MRRNPAAAGISSYLFGYAGEVMLNPWLVLHPRAALMQLIEFATFYGPYKKVSARLLRKTEIKPFSNFMPWVEG